MSFLIFGLMAIFFAAGFGFGVMFENWRSQPERRAAQPNPKRHRRSDISDIRRDIQEAKEALTPK